MTPYLTIKAEAKRQNLPRHYRTDLTKHDRLMLSKKDAPKQFVWILRDCGTHLIGKFSDDDAKRREFTTTYLEAVKHNNDKALFYLFTNETLTPATYEACREFLKR